MQDGEPHLAGTARPTRALLGPTTAKEVGARAGDVVTVSTERGSISLPLEIAEMSEGVVFLPTRSAGCAVRRDLAAGSGAAVRVAKAEEGDA